jgi:hypothetical protein
MVNNNIDVRKAASELYHRLVETKEIEFKEANAAANILGVIHRSFLIDIQKANLGINLLPSEDTTDTKGSMFVKKIS